VPDVRIFLALLLALIVASPAAAQRRRAIGPMPRTVVVNDDFRTGSTVGWEAGFCDYSPVQEEIIERTAAIQPSLGFLLSSHNRSDDIFMFLTKQLTTADGVRPNQRYEVSFRIELASQAGSGCGGIGGAPGESVFLKAGAWHTRPQVVLDPVDDHYRLTVDKGNQAEGGPAASVAGNIANGSSLCSEDAPFVPIERTHRHPYIVQSNALGEIWLLVGTDSGFEGKTTLYYRVIQATLIPAP
jgi:hypothetical protein